MRLEDINQDDKVLYIPKHLLSGPKNEMVKEENLGIVTSKNDTHIFVRFKGQHDSKAVDPTDLYSLKYRQDLAKLLQ